LLLEPCLVDGPGCWLGGGRLCVDFVLRVCDEGELDVASVEGDQHRRVDDLLTPDHRRRTAADFPDGHVVLLHKELDEQRKGQARPVRGGQKEAARGFVGVQVDALQDFLNIFADPWKKKSVRKLWKRAAISTNKMRSSERFLTIPNPYRFVKSKIKVVMRSFKFEALRSVPVQTQINGVNRLRLSLSMIGSLNSLGSRYQLENH